MRLNATQRENEDDPDYCCEASFHCPMCDGHHFGTDSSGEQWVVVCHNEYGACGWSGSYADHVDND